MIFLFAGTSEGRQAAKLLQNEDKEFLCFVATEQGVELLQKEGVSRGKIHCGPLDMAQIRQLIAKERPGTIIDATHPYAVNISKALINICKELQLALVRIERTELKRVDNKLVYSVPDVASAASLACKLGQTIFLTIGSKAAGVFAEIALARGNRIVTRVMPSDGSISKCLDAGFSRKNILTGYGPFSLEENIKDFQDHQVDVIVTKDSGAEGGVQEKIDAALKLGIKIILIERPPNPYNNLSSYNITIVSRVIGLRSDPNLPGV